MEDSRGPCVLSEMASQRRCIQANASHGGWANAHWISSPVCYERCIWVDLSEWSLLMVSWLWR
jgi:hypothetical protein